MKLYDLTVRKVNNEDTPLSQYSGQVILIVNTATKC